MLTPASNGPWDHLVLVILCLYALQLGGCWNKWNEIQEHPWHDLPSYLHSKLSDTLSSVPITDTCLLHGYSKADLTEYSAVLEKGTYLYILYLYFHAFHKNQVIYTPPFIWNSSFHLVLLWLIPMVNNIVVNIIVVRANSFF